MALIKRDKKGFFFTILVISILSLFVLSYSIYAVAKSRYSITKRIETMNSFVFLIEKDLPKKIYVSGFRIILLFENRITKNGTYINNVTSAFNECFFNGTIYEEPQDPVLIDGITFSDIENSLNDIARNINVVVDLSSPKISISQDNPWSVKINFIADLSVRDLGRLASWNRTLNINSYISIDGNFEDPIYWIGTNGTISNKINKTIYTGFVNGEDFSNLTLHLQNSYYINSTLAPSFLDRLEGKNTPSPYGIESLVYYQKFDDQGLPFDTTKSAVDYLYFLDNHPQIYTVAGIDNRFRIDNESSRHFIYQVQGLVHPVSP